MYSTTQQCVSDLLYWSRLNPGFQVPAHRIIMSHINRIPPYFILTPGNQPCPSPKTGVNPIVFDFVPTGAIELKKYNNSN